MKLPTLYKRASTGKITEWTIEIEDNQYRSTAGYTDGVKTTTEWTLCQGKNIGRGNETTPAEQALSEAKAIWTKRVEQGSFEDIKQVDQAVYFKPMLAHSYTDYPDLTFPVYSQPKLDGIRCIVKADGMWTRNGKPIISVPHIYDALKPLFEQDPTLIFDGELYADKFANDFNAIVSLVKKTKPTAQDLKDSQASIQYHIYDLPSHDDVFSKRYAVLNEMTLPDCCVKVRTSLVHDAEWIDKWYSDYVGEGYEGLMVRLDKKYENKRSRSLLKYKSFIDEEYTIMDIVEGLGNKTGMVGAFLFQNKDGKRFSAAPKFNWDECIAMWADKKNLIGKSATVKYFNLTPDGVPRFPYVIKINRESYE
jgi:DNA ligase-1